MKLTEQINDFDEEIDKKIKIEQSIKEQVEGKDHYNLYKPLETERPHDELWTKTHVGQEKPLPKERVLNLKYTGRDIYFNVKLPDHQSMSRLSLVIDRLKVLNNSGGLSLKIWGFDWMIWNKDDGEEPRSSYELDETTKAIDEENSYVKVDVKGQTSTSNIFINGKKHKSSPTNITKKVFKELQDLYKTDNPTAFKA